MKKFTLLVLAAAVLSGAWPAQAINDDNGEVRGNRQYEEEQYGQTGEGEETQTRNQGDDTQIQVMNQEENREQAATGEGLMVEERMQQLLQVRTAGIVGEQVKTLAREQIQVQTQVQEQLAKLDNQNALAKFLVGSDMTAIKNLQQLLEKNRLRISELEQLQIQLANQEDTTAIQEAIQAMNQENTMLQARVAAEEQVKSLLGWLIRLFSK